VNVATTHSRPDADAEPRTVPVEASGTYVVEDGEVYPVEDARTIWYACKCTDGKHRDGRIFEGHFTRGDAMYAASRHPGGHAYPRHSYAFNGPAVEA
jgi:hypothetical protein